MLSEDGTTCHDDNAKRVFSEMKGEYGCFCYRASCKNNEVPSVDVWHPSIHMPREAARLFLRVTSVRAERLQDVDEDQAIAEGANFHAGIEEKMRRSAIDRFAEIWDSTVKPKDRDLYGWAANPWVWVIKFERISKEEAMKGGADGRSS